MREEPSCPPLGRDGQKIDSMRLIIVIRGGTERYCARTSGREQCHAEARRTRRNAQELLFSPRSPRLRVRVSLTLSFIFVVVQRSWSKNPRLAPCGSQGGCAESGARL